MKKVYFTLETGVPYVGLTETLKDGEVLGYIEVSERDWQTLHQFEWHQMDDGEILRFFRNAKGDVDIELLDLEEENLKAFVLN